VWLVVGALLASVVTAVLSLAPATVVRVERQPDGVSYADGSPHYLALKRLRSIGAPIVGGTRYEIWLGRDASLSYGHTVGIDVLGSDPETFDAVWEPDGVRVRFGTGHEVLVPARSFMFGR
jgi:hypothetical protein